MPEVRIEPATLATFEALSRLLEASKLPTEDLDVTRLDGFLIARQGAEIVGGVGVERYGEFGLLRSLVVSATARDQGLGRRLTAAAEELAEQRGIRTLYLLTTTAADYFDSRGYQIVLRSTAPTSIAGTPQFSGGLCPSSSVFMSKTL